MIVFNCLQIIELAFLSTTTVKQEETKNQPTAQVVCATTLPETDVQDEAFYCSMSQSSDAAEFSDSLSTSTTHDEHALFEEFHERDIAFPSSPFDVFSHSVMSSPQASPTPDRHVENFCPPSNSVSMRLFESMQNVS